MGDSEAIIIGKIYCWIIYLKTEDQQKGSCYTS